MPIILQNILITVFAFIWGIDTVGFQVVNVLTPLVVGAITGNWTEAITISGTFTLMGLGAVSIGGASVPNYGLAGLIGSYIAIRSGSGLNTAIAIGIPVGLLAIQLDILVKTLMNFVASHAEHLADKKEFTKMNRFLYIGPVLYGLAIAIPVGIVAFLGTAVVKSILSVIPTWFMNGLSIAGAMLPVVGIAILMHYMPLNRYMNYLIIGFVAAAYLKLPVLAVSLLGAAFAFKVFLDSKKASTANNVASQASAKDQGDDYDE
ncbi:PTS system, IIC component [Pediococcus damnosus]|uniref:PTS system, IIC component n=1 Tax=Pediococcus damnosus TaxID=51663 RepID=A0ABN4NBA7_9LACO|nr:PTS sugar transporter subunit IIC [Pediococcus damnosus]AMV67961.1 PTS system, IIC component [Pediococcus damnosus]AMV70153.1 PTS system, IIC component [Pediococcus damnosus]KRN52501.1 PTS family mannose fructose sorbose porter component IIC [Pediococcus damnosus]PIO84614.1 PTS N-acetylgalactosamine transporter subunit IIA [Pediococcus damnosus]GEA92814.1 PTS N-acetylgalactosamine transporter subunit IIA [Pediococcus damnosus]